MEEVEGIILSETSYGETSKIINVFTKEHGLIGLMAKGAKSMKSPLRSSTIKFSYAKFNIYYKENKLSTLVSADIINPLKNIFNDLTLISYLTYLSDLTYQVIKQSNDKDIYDIFVNIVLKLEEGKDPLVLTNILEIKYLPYLGVGINLNECALCGSKTDIVTLDGSRGGFICKNCYTNERLLSTKAIKLLRMYYLIDIKSISNIIIEENIKKEIDTFLKDYYDSYTGLYLKSKEFLKDVINIS